MDTALRSPAEVEYGPWNVSGISFKEMLDRTLRRKYHDDADDLAAIASIEKVFQRTHKIKDAADLYDLTPIELRQGCIDGDAEGGAGWHRALCKVMGASGHPYQPTMPIDASVTLVSGVASVVASKTPSTTFGTAGAGGPENAKNFPEGLRMHAHITKNNMLKPERPTAYARHVRGLLLAAGKKGEQRDVQAVAHKFARALIDVAGISPVRCHPPLCAATRRHRVPFCVCIHSRLTHCVHALTGDMHRRLSEGGRRMDGK